MRWAQLLPILESTEPPPIPLGELSFLLDGIDPNLLRDLVIARDSFDSVHEIALTRNRFHDAFQCEHEEGKRSERLKGNLVSLTNALYEHVPEAMSKLTAVQTKLELALKKNFPGVNMLGMDFNIDCGQ